MVQQMLQKRGQKATLPALPDGEIAVTLDTKELFIGATGNMKISTQTEVTAQVGAHTDLINIHNSVSVAERVSSNFTTDVLLAYHTIVGWGLDVWEQGSRASSDGGEIIADGRIRTKDLLTVEGGGRYKIMRIVPPGGLDCIIVMQFTDADVFINTSGWVQDGTIITMGSTTAKIAVLLRTAYDGVLTPSYAKSDAKPVITKLY